MHGLDGVVLLSFKKYHIKEQGEVGSLYGVASCAQQTYWF